MRNKVVWLEGCKQIKCGFYNCGRTKQGIVWQPCFTFSEVQINDALTFCGKVCYDAHYKLHPINIPVKKSKKDMVSISLHECS